MIIVLGKQKDGKTSFTNVLPEYLMENYIGIGVNLDFMEMNPIFPIVEQVFSATIRTLTDKGYVDNDEMWVESWKKQVDGGQLRLDTSKILLQSGSRIAFKFNNPSSEIALDADLLDSDWKHLRELVLKKNNKFKDFVIILDNPLKLSTVGKSNQAKFQRIFAGTNSPSLVITSDDNISNSENEDSLYSCLIKNFSSNKRIFKLTGLEPQDILQMIQKLDLDFDIDQETTRIVAKEVREITGGHPYLACVLLEIIHENFLSTGNFVVDTNNCRKFINSRRLNLSPFERTKFQRLDLLKRDRPEIFKTVANIILATSTKDHITQSSNMNYDRNKNLREIILSQQAPKRISNIEVSALEDSSLLKLKQTWSLGLFDVTNLDGKVISSKETDETNVLTKEVRITSNASPMILTYLKIASREIDPSYSTPSFESYFRIASTHFSRDLTQLVGDSLKTSQFLYTDREMNSSACLIDPGMSNFTSTLTAGLHSKDYEAFSKFFTRPFRNAILNGTALRKYGKREKVVLLVLAFENLLLPEVLEICFILKAGNSKEIANLEKVIEEWLSIQDSNMRESYHIAISNFKIIDFPKSFYESFLFLVDRPFRIQKYWNLFQEENFSGLKIELEADLPRELALMAEMEDDSDFNIDLEKQLQMMAFMSASCGLFESAQLGFAKTDKGNFGKRFMILDDNLVIQASLGNLDSALELSSLALGSFNSDKIENNYWKLVYSSWKSHSLIVGSNCIQVTYPSDFIYELQHSIILLIIRQARTLTSEEDRFLSDFALNLQENIQRELIINGNEYHRIIAYYYLVTNQIDKSRNLLDLLISGPTSYSAIQIEAAHMDLIELETITRT